MKPTTLRSLVTLRITPRCTGRREETFSTRRPFQFVGYLERCTKAIASGAGELKKRWAAEKMKNSDNKVRMLREDE